MTDPVLEAVTPVLHSEYIHFNVKLPYKSIRIKHFYACHSSLFFHTIYIFLEE